MTRSKSNTICKVWLNCISELFDTIDVHSQSVWLSHLKDTCSQSDWQEKDSRRHKKYFKPGCIITMKDIISQRLLIVNLI